jgi:hypothetical protein
MQLVVEMSLVATVDAVNAAVFSGTKLSAVERAPAARFISARQGQPGAYRGLFAPLPGEPRRSMLLFTGEAVTTGAGSTHILGQEALRALQLLDAGGRAAQEALQRAQASMQPFLDEPQNAGRGMFCCGKCSVAVWRAMAAGAYSGGAAFIERGLRSLAEHHDDRGHWRCFPFWYTVLALSGLPGAAGRAELRYCAAGLERSLRRRATDEIYSQRRRLVAQRALERLQTA